MDRRGWVTGLLFTAVCGTAGAHIGPRYQLQLAPKSRVRAGEGGGSVQFIGAGTVLIRFGGLSVLTDPDSWQGDAARAAGPAPAAQALPPVDLVLLSHFDERHAERLAERLDRKVPVVGAEHAVNRLGKLGFTRRYPLKTWDALQVRKGVVGLRLTSMPDPAMGAMLDFTNGTGAPYRIYVSGDTLARADIEDIPRRFPAADLALLRLGEARLLGVVCAPQDARHRRRTLRLLAPEHAVPADFSDFDAFSSPPSDFGRAVRAAGLSGKVGYLRGGNSYQFR